MPRTRDLVIFVTTTDNRQNRLLHPLVHAHGIIIIISVHGKSHDAMPSFIFAAFSDSSLMKVTLLGGEMVHIGNGHQ